MGNSSCKRGDLVRITPDRLMVGWVKRVARDGSWVDVLWFQSTDKGDSAWSKRQFDASVLKPATNEQRQLFAMAMALAEAVERGWLDRVPA